MTRPVTQHRTGGARRNECRVMGPWVGSALAVALLGLTPCLARGQTDELRLVSVEPASGSVRGVEPGDAWTDENSILVTLDYRLASAPCAVVNATLRTSGARSSSYQRDVRLDHGTCDPGSVPRGSGRIQKRLVLLCAPEASERISGLRLHREMILPTGELPVTRLVENETPLPHVVLCGDVLDAESPPAAARPGERIQPPPMPVSPPAAARPDERIHPPSRPISPPAAAPVPPAVPPRITGIEPLPPGGRTPTPALPGGPGGVGACTDPAAADLAPRLVGRTTPTRGIVEIVGVVRNLGRAAYASGADQQTVELFEETPGTAPRVVAAGAFSSLSPGAETRLVHRRGWDVAIEFQPRYRLLITYEPDIGTDGNPRNDDCVLGNNEAVLEPERISDLFR